MILKLRDRNIKGHKMKTDYNELLPTGILFNLREIADMKILTVPMAKKLIFKGKLEVVKVGSKAHISRSELIRYLEENTHKAA